MPFLKTLIFRCWCSLTKTPLLGYVSLCLPTSSRCKKRELSFSRGTAHSHVFKCCASFNDRQPVALKKLKKDIFQVSQQGTWCQTMYITKILWNYFLYSFIGKINIIIYILKLWDSTYTLIKFSRVEAGPCYNTPWGINFYSYSQIRYDFPLKWNLPLHPTSCSFWTVRLYWSCVKH